MATVASSLTPQELLALPGQESMELVNGKLVEKSVGWLSTVISGELFRRLSNYVVANSLGLVAPGDASYLFPTHDSPQVRRPDVSFVAAAKLLSTELPLAHARFIPDLAVEVISPNDLAEEVSEKVNFYLEVGVRLVWVIDPAARKASVYHPNGRGIIINANDDLEGEDVVPGFRCKLAELLDVKNLLTRPAGE
ncbi:Uma2 family endonuclease [Anatilimnocola sp. NA78]|uniref:Uma2 family endonuclease n=1 Tax=Anatilimnocola sp. NA78 TaxID=3415683 RepID=UPI003CE560D8